MRYLMNTWKRETAPRREGRDAVGDRQAAGLLRDQIRLCVPLSSSISRA